MIAGGTGGGAWLDQQSDSWIHERIVDRMPLAVAVWRAVTDSPLEMRLIYANPHNAVEVGVDMSPFVGLRFGDAFPAAIASGLPTHMYAVATGDKAEHSDVYRFGDPSTGERWFRLDIRPLGRRCALVSYLNITPEQAARIGRS